MEIVTIQSLATIYTCRCWRCSSEGYCCSECQKEAWLRYHWLECPVAKEWKEVCTMLYHF